MPPILVAGSALRAHAPIAAMPTAWTKDLRPASVLMSAWLLAEIVLIAPDKLPFSACPTTSPLFRSSTRLKPAAIPVIDGCGVIIFLRAIVFLRGLEEVRRRERPALVRRRGEDLRLRLAALKARQPFLNPILAYFLGSPGLGTRSPSKEPLLSNTQSSGAVLTVPARAVLYGVGVIDVALAAIALQKLGRLAHITPNRISVHARISSRDSNTKPGGNIAS